MNFERFAGALRAGVAVGALLLAGCYGDVERVPLADDRITLRDRFLDVWTDDGERVRVVGYGGKILASEDGGETWRRVPSPTEKTLARIAFADRSRGWIVGQDGVVLRTDDGGESWASQSSGVGEHLFGLSVVSRERVVACGDRSRWIATADGGAHWQTGVIPLAEVGMSPEIALAVEEPIYYDVQFLDESTGWVVGDYGNIRATADGGRTWLSRHASLVGLELPGHMRPLRDALDFPALFRIAMRDRERGAIAGVDGLVLETEDGGATWAVASTSDRGRVDAPLFELARGAAGSIALGASGAALRRGERGGWRPIDLRLPLLTWVAAAVFASEGPLAARRGFAVGGRGLLLRTDDGGDSWRPLGPLAGARR